MFDFLQSFYYFQVLHRDLKPSNILVNSNCDLAICDFGLARGVDKESLMLTEYVVTRWYRAPELLCENSVMIITIVDEQTYGWEVDIWSLGCIFAELLGRQPLLQGRNPMNQLKLIIKLLGPQRGPVSYELLKFLLNRHYSVYKKRQLVMQSRNQILVHQL